MKGRPFILAAGGTGGHIMPAAALADALAQRGISSRWFTDTRGAHYSDHMGLPPTILALQPAMGRGLLGKLLSLAAILVATGRCLVSFLLCRPRAVVGFGGYPSLPPLLAARVLFIPLYLHEQNAVLGRVNRLMARAAKGIGLGMVETDRLPPGAKSAFVGNPVRPDVEAWADKDLREAGRLHVLVIGGSQAARILSETVPDALAALSPAIGAPLKISHQSRADDAGAVANIYKIAGLDATVSPFFDDMGSLLASVDVVVARAGASTLAELAIHGLPAVLVPLAIAADGHQQRNAELFAASGGAIVLSEGDQLVSGLQKALGDLLSDDCAKRNAMGHAMKSMATPDAAATFADLVAGLVMSEKIAS